MSRIAFVVDEDFEDSELIKPYAALRQAGYEVEIVGVEAGKHVRGKKGHDETIERAARDSDVASYVALVIPGGFSPDHLRTNTDVVSFVRAMTKQGRVVAAVCHGPSLLVEAGVVKGKTLTSFGSIKTDLVNAGATWIDKEVVIDGNLITSRNPHDLPAFIRAIEHALDRKQPRKAI